MSKTFIQIICHTPKSDTRMPEGPDPQKAPARRWRPNDFLRQSAQRVIQRDAGMSAGRAREVAFDPDVGRFNVGRRDSGRELGRHLELNLGSFGRNLGRRIGITSRFLSPIFHASTFDLPGLLDDSFRHVTIEIVEPPTGGRTKRSVEPVVSTPVEDRPFGSDSSDSDWSDSDSTCEKNAKPNQDSKPKVRQGSRRAGLVHPDLRHSESSNARESVSPTLKCLKHADLETLLEVDQSVSSDESEFDDTSDSDDLFHTDSSDEWELDVRESNPRAPFRFQSIYSRPQNSEEEEDEDEDLIQVMNVEVEDTNSRNVDNTGEHDTGTSEESEVAEELEEDTEVESELKNSTDDILEDEPRYFPVEAYLQSIEEVDEEEDTDGSEEKEENEDYESPLEEEEIEESVQEEEHGENSSDDEGCPSLQGKGYFFENEEFPLEYENEIDGEDDDSTIEGENSYESEQDQSIDEEETIQENQNGDGEEDQAVEDEEMETPDYEVVKE